MASTTSSVSAGVTAPATRTSSSIIGSSTCRRPAVSSRTTSCPRCRAASRPDRAISSAGVPTDRVWTSIPMWSPSCTSWSTAAGRYTSAATSSGRWPSLRRRTASLAAVVVLPEPCSPTSITTAGLALELQLVALASEHLDQLVVHDLDDLLAGLDSVEHVGADRLLAHAGHEGLDDLVVDIGLQQGKPDLAQGDVKVGLGDLGLATQADRRWPAGARRGIRTFSNDGAGWVDGAAPGPRGPEAAAHSRRGADERQRPGLCLSR